MKIFDMHADIGTDCMDNIQIENAFKVRHIDKLKKGEIGGVFTACYFEGKESWKQMQDMILNMNKQIKLNENEVRQIKSKEDLIEDDKLLTLISVEGMCGITEDFENRIQWMYDNGVRVAIMAWNESNALCEGWTHDPCRGLTDAGKSVVKKMNDLNMIIDVSHLNEKSFWDVIEYSKKPIIASHSNYRNICAHGRNLTEQQIKAIAAKGGLIGLNAAKSMAHADNELKTVETLAKHARAMADLVGVEHIGCGFDFMDYLEGWNDSRMVKGMESAEFAQSLPKALKGEGFSDEEVEMICFKNTLNFLKNNL